MRLAPRRLFRPLIAGTGGVLRGGRGGVLRRRDVPLGAEPPQPLLRVPPPQRRQFLLWRRGALPLPPTKHEAAPTSAWLPAAPARCTPRRVQLAPPHAARGSAPPLPWPTPRAPPRLPLSRKRKQQRQRGLTDRRASGAHCPGTSAHTRSACRTG